jgi:predicted RNA-binding Zn-ribbon protein involved in translation (DUF1610 family)
MSRAQKILLAILPSAWAADAERESKQWVMQCPNCGFQLSLWDAGGIRWKALGNPRRRMTCPQCGQTEWFTLFKRERE